jgi:hypothetical protein
MTTTSEFQHIPDLFYSNKKCQKPIGIINSNPRYKHFTQTHFTAGDEEQFDTFRDEKNGNVCPPDISLVSNIFKDQPFPEWHKYKNVEATAVINTFRYIFNKFKKGIFVKILNNKLRVFLPFSKAKFQNEWGDRIKIDPQFMNNPQDPSGIVSFLSYCSQQSGYKPEYHKKINKNTFEWFANNCLFRSDLINLHEEQEKMKRKYGSSYPQQKPQINAWVNNEGDTNVGNVKNMLEELCNQREVPDIEFFINRRDFPILTTDGTEAYNHIWDSEQFPLVSHDYPKYIPILSMVTSDRFADIPMPTYEDWARVQANFGILFPESCNMTNHSFNKNWDSKQPTAVFRGSSTGCGTTIDTNIRLKLAYLSTKTPIDQNKIPYLDAGITKWQTRARKLQGVKYLQTINTSTLPFTLVKKLTPTEQSNYKYIINVDGHVSAFRLSLELNMGSVILLVDSPWRIWYKNMLVPYTHYVPVKKDLSDLIDQIKWCRDNDDKCKIIVQNAEKFFNTYLQGNGILDYMQNTLVNIKKQMGIYLYNIQSPLDIQINQEFSALSYYYPETDKTTNNIYNIPQIHRCFGLLQGVHWIINMLISTQTLQPYIANSNTIFQNKLGIMKQFVIGQFPCVIKTTNDPRKIREHIHEAYITTNSINELCKIIPNFVYTFALYQHNKTTFSVINEFIHGMTLFDYISNKEIFSFESFLLILIQLSLALQIAQQQCAFVHWDLTPWNIILQTLDSPIDVDYMINYNKIIRIKTNIIPIIIDFGKSHVVHNKLHRGFVNMFKVSTVQDILTLIINSAKRIREKQDLNKQNFGSLIHLVNFFTASNFHKDTIKNGYELKNFLNLVSPLEKLIYDNKYDLEQKTPLDLINYIYNMTSKTNYHKLRSAIDFNITQKYIWINLMVDKFLIIYCHLIYLNNYKVIKMSSFVSSNAPSPNQIIYSSSTMLYKIYTKIFNPFG